MNIIEDKVPPYVFKKSSLCLIVVFTMFVALVYVNLFQPFQAMKGHGYTNAEISVYSSIVVLAGIFTMGISRFLLYLYTKHRSLFNWQYALWVFIEIISMIGVISIYGVIFDDNYNFFDQMGRSTIKSILVLIIPYVVSHLYFSRQEKDLLLKELQQKQESISEEASSGPEIIAFRDDKGDLRLSVKKENLLYLESADNYVVIWYIGKSGITKYMLRDSLKHLETLLDGTSIIRCHRSYMVNFDLVKVARRTKEGVILDFGIEKAPEIPVSKGYADNVSKWFVGKINN